MKRFIRSSRRALRTETWQNQTRLALGISHLPSHRCRPAGHALVQLSCEHVYFFNFTTTALGYARVKFPGFNNLPISVFFFFFSIFFSLHSISVTVAISVLSNTIDGTRIPITERKYHLCVPSVLRVPYTVTASRSAIPDFRIYIYCCCNPGS